jgi:imidazolonepropionase-like amidohydrolase
MKNKIIFRGGRIFDGESGDLHERDVLVENDRITGVSASVPDGGEETEIVDCAGRVLMPGLIDAHVHVYASTVNIGRAVQSPLSYLAHFAAQFMRSSLDRGFTTLRDVGGADIGLASAVKDGFLDTTCPICVLTHGPPISRFDISLCSSRNSALLAMEIY